MHQSLNCALKVCSVYSLVAYVDLIGFFEHQIVFVLTKQTGLGPAGFLTVKGLIYDILDFRAPGLYDIDCPESKLVEPLGAS